MTLGLYIIQKQIRSNKCLSIALRQYENYEALMSQEPYFS